MTTRSLLFCVFSGLVGWTTARAEIHLGAYDMAAVRDASTLETTVLQDWTPMAKDPTVRQKLIEITLCEWWSGQKVRLPVTLNAPADGKVCTDLIVTNAGLTVKPAAPARSMLRLLKENGVGVVIIGMGTIDAMQPLDVLMSGMKEHMLATKDARYTPAWIWGMSDMRGITAALAEKDVFQPQHILVTGGSKCGVATAAAGIHDERITAILPYVAPIIDSPGGPYVHGMMPAEITTMNEKFIADLGAGRIPGAPATAVEPLLAREKIRAFERITLEAASAAGWSQEDMRAMCTGAWSVCRTPDHWAAMQKRGLEIFYNQGSNDNVGPGLLALGKKMPDFPIYIIPGGQHGGAKETGFMKQVGGLTEVDDNLYAFAMHHFYKTRRMLPAPRVTTNWDKASHKLHVTATFAAGNEPQDNTLWTSLDRHPDYSMQMEYDAWNATPMTKTGETKFEADMTIEPNTKTVDIITVHGHSENGSKLTVSGPEVRMIVAQ
jgi:PhoPQ-activated pathogenicity-related protein